MLKKYYLFELIFFGETRTIFLPKYESYNIGDITFKIKSVLTWNYVMQQWSLNNRINLMGLYNTFQTNAISNMLIFKCKTIDFEFTLS